MSTIHLHQTTTSTPEQYVAGSPTSGLAARSFLATVPTGPIPTTPSSRQPTPTPGEAHPATPTPFTRRPDGLTDIDVVVVRDGKNLTGWLLGLVLGTVGKSVLEEAFENSVKAIEARNGAAA
jgi:hypothetical protein